MALGRALPQYVIRANRNCKTHPAGYTMVYTGPRNGVCKGWTILSRHSISQNEMRGLRFS